MSAKQTLDGTHLRFLDMQEWKDLGIVTGIIALTFLIFARDASLFARLLAGFIVLSIIPGYALCLLFLPNWNPLERSIVAPFMGLGVTATLAYLVGAFDLLTVSIPFSILIAALSLALIVFLKTGSGERHHDPVHPPEKK